MSMESLLTPAERSAIEAEVQKEIDKELKEKERARLKKQLLADAREQRGLSEAYETIVIDLPESGNAIRVNNREYAQGHSYHLPASVVIMLRDTMQKAWEHQAEIEGRSKDHFRKKYNTRMSMATGAVGNAPFLKA